ncbi:A disintegrin and metalloproteinase with thrombospondin motifs adt-1-like, partial [Chrysoperla carnea]|uniref:A disintegrin and metalloproteinase with thrombospondin motifs adt-1-like n=1 Tax=Chrysoperla carnea TaxID=189513 RepID=UPI001D07B2CD
MYEMVKDFTYFVITCELRSQTHNGNFHNYMTVDELEYYFGTPTISLIPEYDVIFLPTIYKQISQMKKRSSNKMQYKNRIPNYKYSFQAFGRMYDRQEIKPLTRRLESFFKLTEPLSEYNTNDDNNLKEIPHIIKRSDDNFPSVENLPWFELEDFDIDSQRVEITPIDNWQQQNPMILNKRKADKLTIELALFFDAAAYKIFAPYMDNNDKHIRDMLLAYMNGVQALYHHPSLGASIDLVIVRMDIMKTQPNDLPHYDGERSKLLNSFCDYQKSINPSGDADPHHWDMALYVSGLDFYAMENGRKSGITMGLATVGGVCLDKYACIIAELGTTNVFGKPYPSAGFTSVYIMAHEMGHNLGMHHDSYGNNCPKDGYIMSPSRGTNGETLWSSCSAEVVQKLGWAKCLYDTPKKPNKELDHTKFLDLPGQKYTAKKQCEFLLRDRDANILPSQDLSSICYNLQCKTPHRSGFYFAGPALEGTSCGDRKWCIGGDCVKTFKPKPVNIIPGGWSEWNITKCKSGCIEKSLGYQERRRSCTNPVPVNTEEGCDGFGYDVILCKDDKICKTSKRKSVTKYATEQCRQFAKRLPELDPNSSGLQAPHEEARPWMGCAIFCRRKTSGTFYTPRLELNDIGISPYFPDGTWCHKDGGGDYYCVQHHCLPENFQFTKTNLWNGFGEDIPIPQNAHPLDHPLPPSLLSYLSLGPDGKPLQTTLKPGDTQPPKEQDWEITDYFELPNHSINEILPD